MKKKPYRPILYYLFMALKFIFNLLPFDAAVWISGMLGRLIYFLLAKERNKMIGNLRAAFGTEKTEKELRHIALLVFENFGKAAAETSLVHKIIPRIDDWITLEGKDIADWAMQNGRGCLGIGAHFGSWELLGGYLSVKGYRVSVIAKKIYYEKYNRLIMAGRNAMGLETIFRDESPRKILEALKKNRIVGIVGDQDVDSLDGVFVDFFGRPAYTPIAPVRIAMASKAPLIPVFIIREGRKHRLVVEKPIELVDTGNKAEDLRANTQKWVSVQEKYIRQYPHLWVWNHKRWKTQPPQEKN